MIGSIPNYRESPDSVCWSSSEDQQSLESKISQKFLVSGVRNNDVPGHSQILPFARRPTLYIDQLLEKCLYPERYLYPEECQDPDKMARLRANACQLFAKNDLTSHAEQAANCVIEKHSLKEKEAICETLRPLFFTRPLSLSICKQITETMPQSSYFSLTECCFAIQEKNWEAVSAILQNLPRQWVLDLLPELMQQKAFDVIEKMAPWLSEEEVSRLCEQLIAINTLESLQAAEKIARGNDKILVQSWIALKEEHFDLVREHMILLPESAQKDSLKKALSVAQEVYASQNPITKEDVNSHFIGYKAVVIAACVCVFAIMGVLFQKIYSSERS